MAEFIAAPFRTARQYLDSWMSSARVILSAEVFSKNDNTVSHNETPPTSSSRTIIVGILMSLPVIALLISLLSSADPIYADFIQNTIGKPLKSFLSNFGDRIIPTIFVILLALPFITYTAQKEFHPPRQLFSRLTFVNEMAILMTIVALILGSFIIVQWPYIFTTVSAETDLSEFGISTYSEYVRKGFGELLNVTIIVYLLVWLGLKTYRNKAKDLKTYLPAIQMVVLGILTVFVFSILRRVWLYQIDHGWTLIRIYGSIFLIWLMLITITLALRHFYKARWVLFETLATVAIIALIGFFNTEHFIVTNHPPTVNKRVDYVYLSNMSADGYQGWKEAYSYANDVLMNRNYQEKKLLGKDERREIAYAGIITLNLMAQNKDLAAVYASDDEVKAYVDDLMTHYGNTINSVQDEVINAYAVSDYKDAVTNYKTFRDFVEKEELNRRHLLQKIDIETIVLRNFSYRDSVYRKERLHIETNTNKLDKDNLKRPTSSIDTHLQWNRSRKHAYEAMKTDIPYLELFEMSESFRQLVHKISLQPTGEKSVEKDISLDRPLLESPYRSW